MNEYFSNIKDVLKGINLPNINPVYGQIMTDWDEIVGKKFSGKTFVSDFSNKNGKILMFVNVSSSPLVQELSFFKLNLIRKIKTSYNLDIADIIIKIAPKNKDEKTQVKPNLVEEIYDIRPTKEELDKIELSKEDIDKIVLSVSTQKNLSDKERERVLNIIFNDLKTQEWMKQKGFPVCKKCGAVMTRKTFGDANICRFCKNT